MVQLAEKMRQKLLTAGSNSQSNSNDEETVSKQDMQDWLLIVGIASPVTKETAGALYHQQLSRQVHVEFLSTKGKKSYNCRSMPYMLCKHMVVDLLYGVIRTETGIFVRSTLENLLGFLLQHFSKRTKENPEICKITELFFLFLYFWIFLSLQTLLRYHLRRQVE